MSFRVLRAYCRVCCLEAGATSVWIDLPDGADLKWMRERGWHAPRYNQGLGDYTAVCPECWKARKGK